MRRKVLAWSLFQMWASGFCNAAAAGITVSEQDYKRGACMAELQTKAAAKCKSICPHFVVPDVVASAEHYRDVLGFKILSYFLDPPVFAVVARDEVVIHLGKSDPGAPPSPNVARRGLAVDAYIGVNDLDALYAELKTRGAKILEGPTLRVYKCYEMVVEDNFGFRICFSMDTSSLPS